jgi:glycosyltransferase involved in cell wall biosynthesis
MQNLIFPLVSIAIVTYNQKVFLRECINSCLQQDYPNFEIVVADDCSTDGTQEMLQEYAASYPEKFILKLSEKNNGITFNANLANFSCNGKYIAWIAGDDLMLPGKLVKQVEFMENNPNCNICYHNLEVFDSHSNKILYYKNEKLKLNGDIKTCIRYGAFNGACSNMVRKSKTPKNGFDSTLKVASDWLYWIDTLADGGSINYIDEVLGKYRRHSLNITNSTISISQNELDHLLSCQLLISRYPMYLSHIHYIYSYHYILMRFKLPYFRSIVSSFFLYPRFKTALRIFIYLLTLGLKKI